MKTSSALEKKITKAEKEIMKKKEALAKLRRKVPRKRFEDFKLIQSDESFGEGPPFFRTVFRSYE
jgi:predicted dithiol-disulfide oxidoreductase (DUF899 family)